MAENYEFQLDGGDESPDYKLRGIMAEHGIALQYKMLSLVDQPPNKIYRINAICGENVSYGCGLSEFEARNDAAKKILDTLEPNSTNPQCMQCNVQLSQYINYIGSLQELCQARAWELPKYEYHQGIEGVSKNKKHVYTVKCSAGPYVTTAIGKNKKMAKKQAAKLLLKYWVNIL